MSRNVNDLYNFILYVAGKERGAFVTAEEAMANLDVAQMDAFEEYFKPYGETQTIHDALRPFRVYYTFTSDSAGFVTFPADYLHLLGSPFSVYGSTINTITIANEDSFVAALKSQLRPVSNSRPLATDTATGFSIYPQVTQVGYFNYLKRPAIPVLGLTIVGRVETYDPTSSTQLGWSESYVNNIIARSLKPLGINIDEDKIYQYAQQFDQESK